MIRLVNFVFSAESVLKMKMIDQSFKKEIPFDLFFKEYQWFLTSVNISYPIEKKTYEKNKKLFCLLKIFKILDFSTIDPLKSIIYGVNEKLPYEKIIEELGYLGEHFPEENNTIEVIEEMCKSIAEFRLLAEKLEKIEWEKQLKIVLQRTELSKIGLKERLEVINLKKIELEKIQWPQRLEQIKLKDLNWEIGQLKGKIEKIESEEIESIKQKEEIEGKSLVQWEAMVLSSQIYFASKIKELFQSRYDIRQAIKRIIQKQVLQNSDLKEVKNLESEKKNLLEKILDIKEKMKIYHKLNDFRILYKEVSSTRQNEEIEKLFLFTPLQDTPFVLWPKRQSSLKIQILIQQREEKVELLSNLEKEEKKLYLQICSESNKKELEEYYKQEERNIDLINCEMLQWQYTMKIFALIDQLSRYLSEMNPDELDRSIEKLKSNELLGFTLTVCMSNLVKNLLLNDDNKKNIEIKREYLMQNVIEMMKKETDTTKKILDYMVKIKSGDFHKDFLEKRKTMDGSEIKFDEEYFNKKEKSITEVKSISNFKERKNNL